MPASRRSFTVTDAYRARIAGIASRAEREARRTWPGPDQSLEGWNERMAPILTQLQIEAIRATSGYLAALLTTERGNPARPPSIDPKAYAGLSRDGRPLSEALLSPIIGARAALKRMPVAEALRIGLDRATRMVGFEAMQTPRDAMLATIEADERFTGWKRSVKGTCAACMALSGDSAPHFEVHPNCQCVPMPEVSGAPDRFSLPTGAALFAALTVAQQDEAVGPEAAALIREGAPLKDFVAHSPQATQSDFITQRPAEDVA
jgi:hypothetical protein